MVIAIPIFKMVLTYYNNKWQHRLTIRIDVLDYSNPFSIARLYSFNFSILVIQRYNKGGYDLVYKKACFVEIPDVGFYDTMFGDYILEKSKLSLNDLWIFILGFLVIVRTVPVRTELWLSFDEVGNPV